MRLPRPTLTVIAGFAVVCALAPISASPYDPTVRQLVAWGHGYAGESAPPHLTGVVDFSARKFHGIALLDTGTVVAWGANEFGQCDVPEGLGGVVAVSTGGSHCLALKDDGSVVAWGQQTSGQTALPAISDAIGISAGSNFSVILHEGGTVTVYGSNSSGERTVPEGLTGVTKVAAGMHHVLALKNDGTVTAWGKNDYLQATPPGGLSGVTDIAAAGDHSLALKGDGSLVLWGENDFGESGNPLSVTSPRSFDGSTFSTGVVLSDGSLAVWGRTQYGLAQIPSIYTGALRLQLGEDFGLALLDGPRALDVRKKSVKNVAPAGKADSCSVTAVFPDPPGGITPAGAVVTVFVGGATETFTLTEKGSAKVGKSSFKMKLKDGVWTATAKLSGEYSTTWAAEANLWQEEGVYSVALPVQFDFGAPGRFIGSPLLSVKATAGKGGSGK